MMEQEIEVRPGATPATDGESAQTQEQDPAAPEPATAAAAVPTDAALAGEPDTDIAAVADRAWFDAAAARVFSQRVAAARDRMDDFDRIALDPDLTINPTMAATIVRSERGAEVAYHLGRNPDVARRIAELDALSAARELGRIEAQLAAPSRRRVTAPPPPLRALGGGDSSRRDPDAMSYEEYRTWRRTG